MQIGVLVSGSGTILQAMIDGEVPVKVVVSDRPGAGALERAERAGIPTEVVDRSLYLPDREAFTEAVVDVLARHGVDFVAMAGFMTIFTAQIFDAYPGRITNTHPALLPAFPGPAKQVIAETLAAGVQITGCTVHIATPEVDVGPILAQEPVRVQPGDTPETLHERIKEVERKLYPKVLLELSGKLENV